MNSENHQSKSGPRSAREGDESVIDYRAAGVDIDLADRALGGIAGLVRATHGEAVVRLSAGFAGAYRLPGSDRILLASIDGVGTKLLVAVRLRRFRGVGIDLVSHCVNDILVHGGRPLFFMDYVGTGRLNPESFTEIVEGLAEACRRFGCALIGGETAEMPGIYHGEDFDLVGAILGDVSDAEFLDGSRVRAGDVLIGLASDGLHTNGYSLARRIIALRARDDLESLVPGTTDRWGDALLVPHRAYLDPVRRLMEKGWVRGAAHITGGGIPGNLIRILPEGCVGRIDTGAWDVPRLFTALQELGQVPTAEMYRTFNMGVGFILILPPESVDEGIATLRGMGEDAFAMGEIGAGERGVRLD